MTHPVKNALFRRLTGLPAAPPGFFKNQSQLYSAWKGANILCKDDFARLQAAHPQIKSIDIQREDGQMFVQIVMNDAAANTFVLPSAIQSLPVRAVVSGAQRGRLYQGAEPGPV